MMRKLFMLKVSHLIWFGLMVTGDVDPCRDLSIISDELRIKDMEFVEKHLEQLKKVTARGGQSLEVKAKKEEEAIVQHVLKHLQEEKDVRKGDWNNKEVISPSSPYISEAFLVMTKSPSARNNPSSSSSNKNKSNEMIIL